MKLHVEIGRADTRLNTSRGSTATKSRFLLRSELSVQVPPRLRYAPEDVLMNWWMSWLSPIVSQAGLKPVLNRT